MKRSFYLFNPGIMERRDNTLKFTPVVVNEDNTEIKQQPRYIPIEDVAELYAFGSLRANSALFNFLGQKGVPVHFFDYYENYTGSFMPRESLFLCWIQNSVFEGELSEAKLRELKLKIKGIIDQSEDSIIIFTNKIGYNMDKQILGKERMSTDNFL